MQFGHLKRREVITLLGGAAAWPVAARAQQSDRVRRVGALMNLPADDQQAQLNMAAFQQGLQALGWTIGRNLRLDHRWGPLDDERLRQRADELVALTPDVMLVAGGGAGQAVQRASRTVPVVLAQSIDPVGAGFVASLARPGGSLAGIPDGASIGDDRHCAAGITVKRMHQHTRIRCDRAFYPA